MKDKDLSAAREMVEATADVSVYRQTSWCGILINLTEAEFRDLELIRERLNIRVRPSCNVYAQRSAVVALALSRLLVDLERGEVR